MLYGRPLFHPPWHETKTCSFSPDRWGCLEAQMNNPAYQKTVRGTLVLSSCRTRFTRKPQIRTEVTFTRCMYQIHFTRYSCRHTTIILWVVISDDIKPSEGFWKLPKMSTDIGKYVKSEIHAWDQENSWLCYNGPTDSSNRAMGNARCGSDASSASYLSRKHTITCCGWSLHSVGWVVFTV